ncbi:MAG: RDD family protein [Thiohalomonadales bacterium]|nr:RDD family protein [Thiohalomonadales bacterium]
MNPPDSIQYAGFWRRLVAFLLDSFLFSAVIAPVQLLIYGRDYFYWSSEQSGIFAIYGAADFLLTTLLPVLLIIAFWVKLGATPGKLLMDCRVVDANTLEPLSWKKALLRCLAYLVSALPVYLGFVWIAVDKRKQGLHDKLARTLVLHQADDYANVSLSQLQEHFR